jgi:hypothetical protein
MIWIRWLVGTREGALAIGVLTGTVLLVMARRARIVGTLQSIISYFS